jgi:hypothetical protein
MSGAHATCDPRSWPWIFRSRSLPAPRCATEPEYLADGARRVHLSGRSRSVIAEVSLLFTSEKKRRSASQGDSSPSPPTARARSERPSCSVPLLPPHRWRGRQRRRRRGHRAGCFRAKGCLLDPRRCKPPVAAGPSPPGWRARPPCCSRVCAVSPVPVESASSPMISAASSPGASAISVARSKSSSAFRLASARSRRRASSVCRLSVPSD